MRTILLTLPAMALLALAGTAGGQSAGSQSTASQSTGTPAPPDPADQERVDRDRSAPLPVIRETDAAMTCVQIGEEAAQLSQQMGGAENAGLMGSLGGIARAGASMLIPGAGLALAGADALTREDRDRDAAVDTAVRHRWYYLNGLHDGRDCRQSATATASVPAPPSGN